jgi:hypothetical protein
VIRQKALIAEALKTPCLKNHAALLQRFFTPISVILLSIFLPLLCTVQANAIGTITPNPNSTVNAEKAVKTPIQYSGVPYKSGNLRDPFLVPQKPKSIVNGDEEISRGLPPPGIAGTFVAQAVLEGISIRKDRKTAIIRSNDNRAYFLREGDKLFDGYLKIIQEDSITLVRERKMRSGKTLTQEVTKRLRTP